MESFGNILRPSLSKLEPYNAGLGIAALKARYGLSSIAKLGSNENPFGVLPGVEAAISEAATDVHLYPDGAAAALAVELSRYLGVSEQAIVFGNGSEDLLSVICRCVVETGDRIVTLYPSFPLHEDYARLMGGVVERIGVQDDLTINVPALVEAMKLPTKMVIFSNPMNPIGTWLDPDQLKAVIASISSETLLVLDEAYFEYACGADFGSGLELLQDRSGPWVVLRTFSKAWGLAGLRLGYGVCSSAPLKAAFDLARTPFNANAIAQVAALASLKQRKAMDARIETTRGYRSIVAKQLRKMGYAPAPSHGNFLFFDVNSPSVDLAEKLLARGTIVKPWRQSGYDTFLRVSIGTEAENSKFLADLEAVTEHAPGIKP